MRITVVTGHYGSGKTEFSVQYALKLAAQGKKTAIVDLDIANPYFRTRERQAYLESWGIAVYSNIYNFDITADMPAISAEIRRPLEDPETAVVVDAGGDDSGARVLIQFQKYFTGEESELLCVVNANRPETRDADGALSHIERIETELGKRIGGLINNTHLLRETCAQDVLKGELLCAGLCRRLQIPLRFTLCRNDLVPEFLALRGESRELRGTAPSILPFDRLMMRADWLDSPVHQPTHVPDSK